MDGGKDCIKIGDKMKGWYENLITDGGKYKKEFEVVRMTG